MTSWVCGQRSSAKDAGLEGGDIRGRASPASDAPRSVGQVERRLSRLGAELAVYEAREARYLSRFRELEATLEGLEDGTRVALSARAGAAATHALWQRENRDHAASSRRAADQYADLLANRTALYKVARWRDTLDEKTLATEKARDAALESAEAAERAVRDLATTRLRELVKALKAYEGDAQATLLAKKVDQCLDVALLEDEVEDELRCSDCGLNPRTVAIFDCGHLCLCSDCAPAVVDCPVCNQHARETRRVFLG